MISDLLFGLGFVAVVEGLVLALAPGRFGEIIRMLDETPRDTLRQIALVVILLGVVLMWLSR